MDKYSFKTKPINCKYYTINSAHTNDGSLLAVGDIVWGKIHGFLWWPGRVHSVSRKMKEKVLKTILHGMNPPLHDLCLVTNLVLS